MDWPDATTTGMRSGSLAVVLIGGRWTRSCRGASYHRHPVRTGPDVGAAQRSRALEAELATRTRTRRRTQQHQAPATSASGQAASGTRTGKGGDVVLDWSVTDGSPFPMSPGSPREFLFGVATAGFQIEGGYNGPGQLANNWLGLGVGGPGRAVGERRRLLGPTRGGARPGRRPGLQQLPAGCRVGPGRPRTRTGWTGRPGPLRRHRAGLPRPRPRAAGHPAPLHPSGVAGRRLLAPAGRARSLPGLGRAGGRRPGPHGPPLGHHQRDQRPGRRDLAARDVPAGTAAGARGRGHRRRQSARRPRGRLRGHPPGSGPTPSSPPTTRA